MVITFSEQDDAPRLTPREAQVLKLVACGLSCKEVAQQIGIAPRTVERHVENVRHKMRARNKSHMIAKAVMSGELRFNQPEDQEEEETSCPRLVSSR